MGIARTRIRDSRMKMRMLPLTCCPSATLSLCTPAKLSHPATVAQSRSLAKNYRPAKRKTFSRITAKLKKNTTMRSQSMTERLALTRRENEVMSCLAKGRLNKEIADELGISFSAVHKHQHNIFRKLDVGNRTEATLKWIFTRNEAAVPGLRGL